MKVLTVRQPFAWAIVSGLKDVENRTWRPSIEIGQTFLIHASANQALHPLWAERYADIALPPLTFGAIIGSIVLVDVVNASDSRWFVGPIGWVLSDARMYARPLPAVGRQKLWDYPSKRSA